MLSTELRVLALDVGEKRIGLAISDPFGVFASGIGTLVVDEGVLENLSTIITTHHVHRVVVGMPYTLRGEEGASAEMVRSFIETLRAIFHGPIDTLDERFTSSIATRTIRELGVSRTRRREKGKVDEMAAVLLLQSWLDARS